MAKKSKNDSVAENLSSILADIAILSLKTKGYHWNVTGPFFDPLHVFFQKLYEALDVNLDEIAERIRALDTFAPGSYSAFSKISDIKEAGTKNITGKKMLEDLYGDYKSLSAKCHSVLHLSEDSHDEATADMMVALIQELDKSAWMIKSQLE
jgi:starvation-inducible DNA-binding protein